VAAVRGDVQIAPASSIIFLSNSLSVMPDMLLPFLQNGFPKNFLKRRLPHRGLVKRSFEA